MTHSFNPCFNGINIQTCVAMLRRNGLTGFNPCFNGINIQTILHRVLCSSLFFVSILVLMESTFRQAAGHAGEDDEVQFQSLF